MPAPVPFVPHWPPFFPGPYQPSPYYPTPTPYGPSPYQPSPYAPPVVEPLPPPQAGYQWVLVNGAWVEQPIVTHATEEEGIFSPYANVSHAIAAYRRGTLNAEGVAAMVAAPRLGLTPNPMRICNIINIANIIGPLMSQFISGFTWHPIPLPPQCATPTPSSLASDPETPALLDAVYAGMRN